MKSFGLIIKMALRFHTIKKHLEEAVTNRKLRGQV
jgi:hypothetical protein